VTTLAEATRPVPGAPRHATTRVALMWRSWWCKWRPMLAVVQPETFIWWRCQGFRWFCHGTPSPGRPPISVELPARIQRIAHENLMRGQRRIANELRLKLGLRVSPRTVHT
jgi:putative transposase